MSLDIGAAAGHKHVCSTEDGRSGVLLAMAIHSAPICYCPSITVAIRERVTIKADKGDELPKDRRLLRREGDEAAAKGPH